MGRFLDPFLHMLPGGLLSGLGVSRASLEQLLLAVTWTAQTPGGAATLPSGGAFTRASTGNVPNGAAVVTGLAIDVPRAASMGGLTGLLFEGATTNLLTGPRTAWDSVTWTGAPVGGGATTQDNAVAGPDGVAPTAHHVVPSAGTSRYKTSSTLYTAGVAHTVSAYLKQNTAAAWDMNLSDAAGHNAGGTLGGGWERHALTITPSGTSGAFVPADGRNGSTTGGIAAGSRNYNSDMHQLERRAHATSWHATTRAGERLTLPGSAIIRGGRLRLRIAVYMPYASTAQDTSMRVWTLDAHNYVEIDLTTKRLRVVVGGVAVLLAGALAWAAGDTLTIRLDAGNGMTSGWWAVGAGARSSLSSATSLPFLSAEGAAVDIGSAGTTKQLEGLHLSWEFFTQGSAGAAFPGRTVYASPSGSGNGLTVGAPASLATGLSTARAYLAAGASTRLVLRGGTYALAATLAFTAADRMTIAAYPGEVPELSGGVAVTGWTLDSGSVYKASVPAGATSRGVVVKGVRAQRGRSAVTMTGLAGWSWSAGGWTAASSTIAGYARPQDVEILSLSATAEWKMARTKVASASGTAITLDAADLAARDHFPGYEARVAIGWENARELVAAPGDCYLDPSTDTIYYWPRGGDNMATADARLPLLETLISIDGGSLDTPVAGLVFEGITFSDATWLPNGQMAGGYTPLQGPALSHGDGSYSKVNAAVQIQNAQGVAFRGCTWARLGGAGLDIGTGTQGWSVRGSTMSDISSGAVILSWIMPADQRPADDRATVSDGHLVDCAISSVGVEFWSAAGIFGGFARRTTIANVTIDDVPWSGITLGWGWGAADAGGTGWPAGTPGETTPTVNGGHVISNVLVDHFCQKVGDGGAIYLNGAQNGGTAVSGCYAGPNNKAAWVSHSFSLYLDNGCTGVVADSNVGWQPCAVQGIAPIASGNVLSNSWFKGSTTGDTAGAHNTYTNVTILSFGAAWPAGAAAIIAGAARI